MRVLIVLLSSVLLGFAPWAAEGERSASDEALLQGFLPKEDLGILEFLSTHADADGRGIIVAILDTGVDLAHAALQTTPTGAPKILDLYDGTDDGYLPLSLEVKQESSPIRGLSGRRLVLPAGLEPDEPFRMGILVGREFFPGGLADRRGRERRSEWERRRQVWEGEGSREGGPYAEAVREALEQIVEEDADPGDRFDVAAFRRGDTWEVRIDLDADGDFAEEKPLRPYRQARDLVRFPDPYDLAVAVERIAPDASAIFLFFDEGGHGTHVAGIVGGYYGDGDPLNGLAPGVQLLAAKVGNGRFGGSTSHNSIIKSAQWAVDHGADIINLSFGGSSFFDDGNEVTSTFLNELVERTGVIVCSSAGNAGPALSTVGSPGSARRVFGWGAAISTKTQQTNYGTLDPRRDDLFHFTSRGPLLNGDPGVDFISPGAALSPLPTWGLVKGESWNGTSMASPQGAGLCALLLSACREEGIPVTPARLRRAMQVGARRLPGVPVLEQGDGIPQAMPTLDALRMLATEYPSRAIPERTPHDVEATDPVVRWVVSVRNATGTGGGYYERDLRERSPFRIAFDVRPDFPIDSLQADRAGFLRIVTLTSEVAWLRAPLQESLHSGGATIPIQVDPSRIGPGLNVGRIVARDVSHPDAGIEFALVATVIRPEQIDPLRPLLEERWDLESGDRRSVFLRVPAGARLARFRLRELTADPANAYQVALSEPDLLRPPEERGTGRQVDLAAGQEGEIEIGVLPGGVLEAVAFSRWHHNRPGSLSWRIEFLGVETSVEPPLAIEPARPGVGFVLGAPAWGADLRLSASLDREEEPFEVRWRVRPDSLFPTPLNGIPAMLQEGEGLVEGKKGEDLEVDLRIGPEFEDLLDDSFYRAYDDSDREIAAGYLHQGMVRFRPPATGVYRIVFSVWTRGTGFFDDGSSIVSPVVLRPSGPHELAVYRDPVDGFRAGSDRAEQTVLVAGECRRFFVRAEDLPEGNLLRGSVKVTDRDGSLLARIPLRADTRRHVPPSAAEVLSTAVAAAVKRAHLLAGRSDVPAEAREVALAEISLCERLRLTSPQPPPGKSDRRKTDEEEHPPQELWDLREAAVRLVAAGDDLDRLEDAVKRLREGLPSPDPAKPQTVSDRRRKEAIVEWYAAELTLRRGKAGEARKRFDVALGLDPDLPGWKRFDAILLIREEKIEEAHKRAQGWLDEHPDDREIDTLLVRALLERGWWDLAALRLAGWPRRHPSAGAELIGLWEEVEKGREARPLAESPLVMVTR